mgnify:CR=1 FL=1
MPLIEPSDPVDGGLDNVNGDLIVYKDTIIVDTEGNRFKILEKLGAGQFGHVYKCQYIQPGQTPFYYAMKISKSTADACTLFQYEMQALHYVCI